MFLLPHIVLRTSSRYNPDIRVVREWGGTKLLVNGSRQSGPYIRMLWEKAFRGLRLSEQTNVRSILVLGIGGGTVIELLAKRYPQANITAVDIDQTIIDIAKNYFYIDHIPRLSIVRADARAFSSAKRFDRIIVDLFIGREIPPFVSQAAFYTRLKKMLSQHGIVVVNFLRELEYQHRSDALFDILKRVFFDVQDFTIANNRFFCCRS